MSLDELRRSFLIIIEPLQNYIFKRFYEYKREILLKVFRKISDLIYVT